MEYIKVVADSSANLCNEENSHFASVPLKILTDGKEYVDSKDLDVSAMLRELREFDGHSGTSCPSPKEWFDAFGDAKCVLGVSLTSKISGCYNVAKIAAEDYSYLTLKKE